MTPMTPMTVAIEGGGVTALSARALGQHQEFGVSWASDAGPLPSTPSPTLVLNSVSLALLRSIAPTVEVTKLGVGSTGRVVRWAGERPRRIVEDQRVVTRSELLSALSAAVGSGKAYSSQVCANQQWKMHTRSRPDLVRLGQRQMFVLDAESVAEPMNECLVESVDSGWLFAMPQHDGRAQIQIVRPPSNTAVEDQVDAMLRQSVLIAPRYRVRSISVTAAAAPSIAQTMSGPGWVRAGSAFTSLDPISGEGTAFAMRSVILLFAALAGIAEGRLSVEDALGHVEHRIRHSFHVHLRGCIAMYESAFSFDPSWRSEIAAMTGHVRTAPHDAHFTHHLEGFTLVVSGSGGSAAQTPSL